MKRNWQPTHWRIMAFVLAILMPVQQLAAAAGRSEISRWNALENSRGQWATMEGYAAQFQLDFEKSEHYADAVLRQAEARYELAKAKVERPQAKRPWNFADVIEVLSAHMDRAGDKADGFEYWWAMAEYSSSNYLAAADRFGNLARETNSVSKRRAEALYREAEARSQTGEWGRVAKDLHEPDGIFQQLARANPTNEWVIRGVFLLGRAELTQTNAAAAEEALGLLESQKLASTNDWRREELLCNIKLAAGKPEEALLHGSNLLQSVSEAVGNPERALWTAEAISLIGQTYRGMDRLQEAVATYETNLESSFPERKQDALVNIVDLELRQGRRDDVAKRLEVFLAKNAKERGLDVAFLTLGELRLGEYDELTRATPPPLTAALTNKLFSARTNFEEIITYSTNSPFLGNAYLNLGWCLWMVTNLDGSLAAFSNAAARLPFGEHQAVAYYKLGDAYFLKGDNAAAIRSYSQVVDKYSPVPVVKENLLEPCLYQILKAATGKGDSNLPVASNALAMILQWFPDGFMGEPGTLLWGQALNREGNAAEARQIFENELANRPLTDLRPEIELAIARTYERQEDWTNAVKSYDGWIARNTNHPALPRAEFSRAWAEFKAGNETNAFNHMTNFVATYPTNELAAKALYWIGDYYWAHEDYPRAELSYRSVFTGRPASEWQNLARMMAGRAAMNNRTPKDAVEYFQKLATDTNCPPDLAMQARFACGDAAASAVPGRFDDAIKWFQLVADTTHPMSPLAWGRIGDCRMQLAAQNKNNPTEARTQLQQATNAYWTVTQSRLAELDARCQAEIGLAMALEGLAKLEEAGSPEQRQLLLDAKGHYLVVTNANNLREEDKADPGWVKEAGLKAGKLLEEDLGEWDEAYKLYQSLSQREDMPQLKSVFKQRIENAQKHLGGGSGGI